MLEIPVGGFYDAQNRRLPPSTFLFFCANGFCFFSANCFFCQLNFANCLFCQRILCRLFCFKPRGASVEVRLPVWLHERLLLGFVHPGTADGLMKAWRELGGNSADSADSAQGALFLWRFESPL